MGFEDQVEQSLPRHCRKMNGRPKRTYELTSSMSAGRVALGSGNQKKLPGNLAGLGVERVHACFQETMNARELLAA
jgi:hypothetical protein